MGTSQHEQLPPDLVRGQRQFQAWREQRKPGDSIPQSLWAVAIRLANAHGASRTAAVLRLDYYRLKNRAAAGAVSEPQPRGPAFVELTPPVLGAKQCQFELDNGAGATMRVQLVGYDAADIEALARGFWDAR
jgi:hypothetical protein